MLPTRFVPGQAPRKSRLGERQSFLPRRLGSTDRLSDSRRPSGAGPRSSSADTGRSTGAQLSREASAQKAPTNRRSRSQQGESRPGQSATTPLHGSQYPRPTTTPLRSSQYLRPTTPRTPSGDRSRSWEASVERALACVTVKDTRPITNTAWQRATLARVQEALAARDDAGAALIRPLTIARFVDIAGALLHAVTGDGKLSNDNYVTKLPHMCKRVLYPGTISKSWLKAVNTLHAFPQALALIAYLLDLLQKIESPVSDEWLYLNNDELSRLRREYLRECFIRFQMPESEYEDLTEDYLQRLKALLGIDDDKIRELEHDIEKYEQALAEEMESSAASRSSEASKVARRDALVAGVRAARLHAAGARAALDRAAAARRDLAADLAVCDADIARATAETAALRRELEEQAMSVGERARLLDEVDYATRVHDSKRVLADQIAKMVQSKETELALWQKKTLDSCVEYKQGFIHLSAQFPELAALAVDETQLMQPGCAAAAGAALDALRALAARLAQRRAQLARTKTARATQRQAQLEQARGAIAALKSQLQEAAEARARDAAQEAAAEEAAARRRARAAAQLRDLHEKQEEYQRVLEHLKYWKKQDEAWRAKLSEMREYIRLQKENLPATLEAARKKRIELVAEDLRKWKKSIDSVL